MCVHKRLWGWHHFPWEERTIPWLTMPPGGGPPPQHPTSELEALCSGRQRFPLCIYVTNTNLLQTDSAHRGGAMASPHVGTASRQVHVHGLQHVSSPVLTQGLCFGRQLQRPGASSLGPAGAISAAWCQLPCRQAPAGTRQGRLSASDARRGLLAVGFPRRLGTWGGKECSRSSQPRELSLEHLFFPCPLPRHCPVPPLRKGTEAAAQHLPCPDGCSGAEDGGADPLLTWLDERNSHCRAKVIRP